MFTGIIEELGIVRGLDKTGAISKLQVSAPKIAVDTQPGQSVCVNGVCLTCVEAEKDLLAFEIMQESLKRTNLGLLRKSDKINLERALRADGRVDGHFVAGHIDETGVVSKRQKKGSDLVIEITTTLKQALRYIALKGSVALDGVSLTVSAQRINSFSVHLIPYTLYNTTLGLKKEGNLVNIECDILAKYLDKFPTLNKRPSTSNLSASFLQEHGFI